MAARSEAPPRTFTIGFPGHGDVIDEREYARASARAIGTEHTRHGDGAGPASCPSSSARVRRLEEPCGIPSAPGAAPALAVRRAEREGGAVRAGRRRASRRLRAPPGGRRAGTGRPPGPARPPAAAPRPCAWRQATSALAAPRDCWSRPTPPSGWCAWWRSPPTTCAPDLVGSPGAEAAGRAARRSPDDVLADVGDRGLVEQALYLDTRMFLPDRLLICADKMSMAASLEQRVPFLDVELMRFVERVPARERVRPRQGKRLHRSGDGAAAAARDRRPGRSTGSRRPTRPGCASRWARRYERRYAARGALGDVVEPATSAAAGGAHRSGPRRPQGNPLLPARALGVASRVHRGRRAHRRGRGRAVKRVLYVHSRKASFVAIDRDDPRARSTRSRTSTSRGGSRTCSRSCAAVVRADLVFGWFASWHTFLPITLAWLLRKPVGADRRRLRHGQHAGHRLRLPAGRPAAVGEPLDHAPRHAPGDQLRTTRAPRSRPTRPIPPERVTVVHHGVPDPFGPLDESRARERMALTVGHLVKTTLMQKGHQPVRGGGGDAARRAVRVRRQVARRRDRAAAG